MEQKLHGKVAVVTGGGRGLGEAIARRFAHEGCKVAVCGRDRSLIETVARAIGGLAVVADVSREDDVRALFAASDRAFGRLDVLVNNAGVAGRTGSIAEEDMAAWDELYAINVRGTMLCIKHAMPRLKRRGGAIVNLSSIGGKRANPRRAAYGSSKYAVIGLTRAVALEAGPFGVRVNAVCPGAVETDMLRDIFAARGRLEGKSAAQVVAETAAKNALRRMPTPAEVAEAVLFLASDAASAITGECLTIDAGKA